MEVISDGIWIVMSSGRQLKFHVPLPPSAAKCTMCQADHQVTQYYKVS